MTLAKPWALSDWISREMKRDGTYYNSSQSNNLSIMNTFFRQSDYSTFFTPKESAPCMLDVWTTSDPKRFKNCKVCKDFGIINSDHLGVLAEISLTSIRDNRDNTLSEGLTDWKTIQYDEEKNNEFNDRIEAYIWEKGEDLTYTELNKIILRAARETALKPKNTAKGWYEMSKETMQPLCESKYKVLAKVKSVPEAIKPFWEVKLKEINKQIQGETAIAKAKWHHNHAIHINQMDERGMAKNSWEHMREMQDGFSGITPSLLQ
jgi:hypothetical protein